MVVVAARTARTAAGPAEMIKIELALDEIGGHRRKQGGVPAGQGWNDLDLIGAQAACAHATQDCRDAWRRSCLRAGIKEPNLEFCCLR